MSTSVFTDSNFQSEVLNSKEPVLVDFWAEWCGPCRMVGPIVEKIGQEFTGKLKVGKLNVDENSQTPQKYGIQGIPTIIMFKGGKDVNRVVGFQPEEKLKGTVQSFLDA
jgi:thioredoxin 1